MENGRRIGCQSLVFFLVFFSVVFISSYCHSRCSTHISVLKYSQASNRLSGNNKDTRGKNCGVVLWTHIILMKPVNMSWYFTGPWYEVSKFGAAHYHVIKIKPVAHKIWKLPQTQQQQVSGGTQADGGSQAHALILTHFASVIKVTSFLPLWSVHCQRWPLSDCCRRCHDDWRTNRPPPCLLNSLLVKGRSLKVDDLISSVKHRVGARCHSPASLHLVHLFTEMTCHD